LLYYPCAFQLDGDGRFCGGALCKTGILGAFCPLLASNLLIENASNQASMEIDTAE
jgi:hypothetical protein